MAKTLEQAIDKVLNDYENVLKKAVKYASDKTAINIFEHSMTCLEQYYDAYDPTSYRRTESLQKAILPYAPLIKKNKKTISSTVGVTYDSSQLIKTYYGSKQYSPVDDEYVLLNYLYGIHPITNGAMNTNDVVYYEVDSGEDNPWNNMETYLKNEVPKLYTYRLIQYFVQSIK